MNRAQAEYVAATLIVVLLLVLFVPAALTARAEVRDDLRRSDITNLKRAAEMFNNAYNFYPAPPQGAPPCTSSSESNSWLFGSNSSLLEGHIDAIPHDVREGRGHVYTYCATEIYSGQALGYYFEAQLEVQQADRVDLDEDETRNFHYRILHDGNRILYRVCGGTEPQCDPS